MTRTRTTALRTLLISAAAIFPVANARAQQAATTADAASGNQIGEIVVTAQRRSESAQKVPITITALTAASLEQRGGLRNSLDLTRLVPGLQINSLFQASNPTIYLRGVGVNNYDPASAGAVGVVVDDVFLNSGVGALFSTYDLDRVEVLKGPQGTLFGRNTTGGVINYITKRPTFDPSISSTLTVGRYNQVFFDAGVGDALIKDKLAFRASVSVHRRDGWATNVEDGRDMNDINVYAGRLQLLYRPTDDVEIQNKIEGGRSRSSAAAIKSLGTYNEAAGRPCTGEEVLAVTICSNPVTGFKPTANIDQVDTDDLKNRETLTNFADRLSIAWTGDTVSLTSISAYVSNVRKLNQDQDGEPYGLISSPIWNEKSRQVSQEIRLASVGNGPFKWVLGAYYLQERFHALTNFDLNRRLSPDPAAPFYDPADTAYRLERRISQTTESKAIFAQADYKLTEKLTATAGIRFTDDRKNLYFLTDAGPMPGIGQITTPLSPQDRTLGLVDSDQNDPAVNPPAHVVTTMKKPTWRLALAYQATPNVNLYASYSRGVRSGGYNTVAFFVGEFNAVKPERLDAFEAGIKTDLLDRHLRLNLSGFYYKYHDQEVFSLSADENGNVAQRLENADSRIYGAEFQIEARPFTGLDINVGGTYLNAKYTDFTDFRGDFRGQDMENTPKIQLSGDVNYTTKLTDDWNAHANANFSYQSRVYFSPFNTAPSTGAPHAVFDLSFGAGHARAGLDLTAWVKNVANKRYVTDMNDLTAFGTWFPVYNEPRTYGLTLSYKM